ncbi:phage tail tape measure protein [Streptomyces cyanogenus]|uniref:Phage-related minor tail protein n=1 Tax=Streptomyces cyanogenus TaxID=80860 RepID=A0ABX7TJX5_STRCY|nr:phage tail tape measure protein [Streptomyces cyanogenus]QTD96964.1 Phage-related minor tail protein [Streptomyces cyanogenus]
MASTAVVYRLIARDNASRVFNNVGRSAQRLQTTSERVGAALKKGLTIGAIATAGLGASVVQMAGDFEKNMNRVEALSGATGSQLKKLRDQAKDLGRSTQYSASQSADAMAQLATAGLNVNQIYGSMPSVLALASSEQLDLTRSAEISTSVMTGYGMTVKQMPHAIDAMVKASVKANTSVDDLGEAFKYAGPIAHTAGLKFEETVASMALMGNAGIKASMAGTALRGAVTRLLSPTNKITETLDDLGVKVSTADGKLRPLNEIVQDLAKHGATTGQIMTIFGQRAGPGMAALIQQGSDKLVGLTKELENSGGTADRISKIQMKGWRGEITRLKNAWEGLMIAIGDSGVLTVATKALSGVTTAVGGFASWVNERGVPAAQNIKSRLGDIVPVGDIKRQFGEAKTAVSDFLAGLSGNNVKNVAVPSIDKAPVMVSKGHAADIGRSIHDAIAGGVKDIDWGNLGSILGKGLSDAIGWVGQHAADMTKKFAGILAGIDWVNVGKGVGGQAIPFAIGFINDLFKPLFSLDFWKKHWLDAIIAVFSVIPIGRIAGVLGKLFSKIPILKIFSPILRGIEGLGGTVEKGLMKTILKPLARFGRAVWDGIVKGFTKVFPQAAGKIDEWAGKMALNILGYAGRMAAAGLRMIQGLGRGILSFGTKIGEYIGRVIGWLVKPFARAGSWLWTKGKAIVVGLKDGVVSAARGIAGWAWRNVGRPAVDAFKGVGSWLWSKGRAFVVGLKNGVVAGAKGIGGWIYRNVVAPQVTTFARAGSWLWSRGKQLVGGMKNGVLSAAKGIGGWAWRNVGRPAVDAFKNAGSWLWSKGKHLISGLKDGIVSGVEGIGGWIKTNLIDPVVGAVKHFFGIRSPSRVFMGIGGHLVSGLMKGMAKTSGTAIAKKVFGSLPKALGSIVKKGLVKVSELPGKALKALGSLGGDFLGLLGLGGSGGSSSANQKIGQMLAAGRGWSGQQWIALRALWNGESGWNERALNKASGAYGIPQSLPASKMASAGSDWRTNAATQIKWGLNYIAERYGSPLHAYSQWLARSPHWYAKGTGGAAPGLAWVGERGPELVNFKGGEDVLSHPQSMAFAKAHGIKLPGYASGTIENAADRQRRARQKVEDAKDDLARAKRRHKGVAAAEKRLKAAEKELQAAEIALRNAKRSAKNTIANSIKTGLEKTLATGTASAIGSAIKSLATKLLNAGYGRTAARVQKQGAKLQRLSTRRADIQKRIAEANQYAADQAGNIRDFLSISGTSATNVGDLISQMGGQQKTASNFVALTKSLKARGASKALLQQLSDAGPGSQLATILGQKNVTTGDIAKLNKLISSGGKLATSFGRDMADMMYDSGKDAGKGFLAGLKAQEKALGKQMAKLAKDLIKEIKKALKIKSPSGVFRDEVGKNVVLGMAEGIDLHGHLVGAAAQRLAGSATDAYKTRRYVPTTPRRRPAPHDDQVWERLAAALESLAAELGPEVHVHFNDDRLRNLIDVQVRPKIKASEDRQAYLARVGRRLR